MWAFSYEYLPNVIAAVEVPGQAVKCNMAGHDYTFDLYSVEMEGLGEILHRFRIT